MLGPVAYQKAGAFMARVSVKVEVDWHMGFMPYIRLYAYVHMPGDDITFVSFSVGHLYTCRT